MEIIGAETHKSEYISSRGELLVMEDSKKGNLCI